MKLVLSAATVLLAAGTCCCGDLLRPLMEQVAAPAAIPGTPPDALDRIPVYPGAEYFAGASLGDTVTANWYVTGAATGEIVEYYRSSLEADGWTIDTVVDLDELSSLDASRDGETLDLSASETGERVLISLSLESGA